MWPVRARRLDYRRGPEFVGLADVNPMHDAGGDGPAGYDPTVHGQASDTQREAVREAANTSTAGGQGYHPHP
jgi:hypothetical protein